MKVLLFVQTGDARPKCVSSGRWMSHTAAFSECVGALQRGADVLHTPAEWKAARADRWWLVECENADEGRMIIGCCPLDDHRILASGWKP